MSSVGLSFGSPTGGQGINVSATVSQITAIMQNVEVPWQTQLTQLQAQDTVYTTLGTDMSNLSTSLSDLSEFQGVLQSMQGSSSNTNVLQLLSATNTALAGSHTVTVNSLAQTASYYSEDFANPSDLINGSLTLTVNGGTPVVVNTDSGGDTIAQFAADINNANAGVTANVITDSGGQRLSLESNTSGTAGNFTIGTTLTDATTPANTIAFTQPQVGSDASFTVDGIPETSSSNTVSNAIPGVSFQLLSAAAGSPVQVEIANDNAAVETAFNSFVTAYNQAITDLNTQEGNTSTGTPEPLFGNPNISLLQSQLQSALTFTVASGLAATGSQSAGYTFTASSAANTFTAPAGTFGTGANGTGLSAAITTPSTLTQIAADLNAAGTGYTATLDPTNTILTVNASSSTPATLYALPQAATYTSEDFASPSDVINGSLTLTLTGGSPVTINTDAGGDTIAQFASDINNANAGVTASIITDGGGQRLSLVSNTNGTAGNFTVGTTLTDATTSSNNIAFTLTAPPTLQATGSGSLTSITQLGITVNNDGTLTLDTSSLDATLNSNYQDVVNFLQPSVSFLSFGSNFTTALNNLGTQAPDGAVYLAQQENQTVESSLQTNISNENTLITQQSQTLTTELNEANYTLTEIPQELQYDNELYSSLSGYNVNTNG